VQRLYDVFSYDLDLNSPPPNDITILYGDNGSGKTNLLFLLFHVLSAGGNKGHMTEIASVPFLSLRVTLSDGTMISVRRDGSVGGYPLNFKVERPHKPPAAYSFVPDHQKSNMVAEALSRELNKSGFGKNKNHRVAYATRFRDLLGSTDEKTSETAHQAYCAAVRELGLSLYFLGTDRRLLSDNVEHWMPQKGRDIDFSGREQISSIRAGYLKEALQRSSKYVGQQIIRASNTGSKNINDIYAEIFRRILSVSNQPNVASPINIRSLIVELRTLKRRQRQFVKLGLSPDLDVNSFMPPTRAIPEENLRLLGQVLVPFVATLRARLDALEPIRESVEIFLRSLNGFFKYKNIDYHPASGFQITGPTGEKLTVDQLSSGEQQLLLIFCSVLASNDSSNIFIIDEPEISLNIKWQREIVGALSKIKSAGASQLLMSTHSIELLAQYSDSVVGLDPVVSQGRSAVFDLDPQYD
jgi:energy-coupling factor transporter ATP-binding protein EcfA2